MGFLHVAAFGISLAAFIIALTGFPYSPFCVLADFSGCQTLKVAIALDGVLWLNIFLMHIDGRVLFLLSALIIFTYAAGSRRVVQARRRRGMYYNR